MTGSMQDAVKATLGLAPVDGLASGQASVDISLQLAIWADPAKTARRLARMIGADADRLRASLHLPTGFLLESLPTKVAVELSARLARCKGVVVTLSDPATARYDIHLTRTLDGRQAERLASICRLIGARRDPLTEAVATDLDRPNKNALLHRLPDLGLLAVDRRFQRFDLLLTGVTGWTTAALADFLVARTQKPRAAFEQLSPAVPVTLDLGLKADIARQFCADYAALGLLVRPVLSMHPRNA